MFIDREREIAKIAKLLKLGCSLALLYGKRRVGKTRLLREALGPIPHVYFLAKVGSAEENLRDLLAELQRQLPDSLFQHLERIESWSTFFALLQGQLRQGKPLVLVLDEFQYLVEAEAGLASLIQRFWDQLGEKDRIHLFLCGSGLGMLSALGSERQPLYGRLSWQHELSPFDYFDAAQFVPDWPPLDRMRTYATFGGLARHLEMLESASTFDQQLVEHMIDPLGGLHNALERMLQTENLREPGAYASVLSAIGRGRTRPGEIQSYAALSVGSLNNALKGLQNLRMVERWVPFGEKPTTTRSVYRLSDPYLMFHTRFVDPHRSVLEKGDPDSVYEKFIRPHLRDYMGQVFERICHQALVRFGDRLLGAPVRELSSFWSRDGQIEIDLIGKLAKNRVLTGECKWRENRPVGTDVLGDLKRKVALTGREEWRRNAQYLIASSSGFTDELKSRADVILLGPDQLLT